MSSVVIPAFEVAGIREEVMKMKDCGKMISVIECTSCQTRHFAGFNRCKSRWCVTCAHVKVLAWVARILPVAENWLASGGNISMLNFTIKDVDNLDDGLTILNESFRALYNVPSKRKRWQERFPGGIRSLEVKRGKNSRLWHPHIHSIVLQPAGYRKDFAWLKTEWERYTSKQWKKLFLEDPEKTGSVWIKKITGKNLLKSVCETLKYIVKPELSLYKEKENLLECVETLKGKRQINTWGLFRGLNKDVDEDIEKSEEKKLTDFICQRCGCTEGELKKLLYDDITILYDC